MRQLTSRPFGVNLALLYLQSDDSIVDHVIGEGVRFVTTSAGDPFKYIDRLKKGGLTVYHSVPSLAAAQKAVRAGVDGLIVEGSESGAVRNPNEIGTIVLLQLVRAAVALPIVAAGGIADGRGMAAAFALGAEGIQMGTRLVASVESPVHKNYKTAILNAGDTGTLIVNRNGKPCMRVLRTALAERLEAGEGNFKEVFGQTQRAYFEGDLEAGIVSAGQSSAVIDQIKTTAEIIEETMSGFSGICARMGKQAVVS
jgi:enoyl-[acyl-carrier protein] reductase II